MADTRIDDATADTLVTGIEEIPASDGGAAKKISVAQIRDFVIAAVAASAEASSTDLSADGVYIRQGGVTKRLLGTKLAQAILDYACSLAGIATPNGNEIFVIDDSGTKKTITLSQLVAYVTANTADLFASLSDAGTMAASDLVIVKQGGNVRKGTLADLAAYACSTFAAFLTSSVNVLNVQTSDKIAVVSGGVTKWMTVAQLASAIATGATVPSETTAGNVPTYADAAGTLGTGLGVQTTVRAQGTADNNSLATEAAVRAAIDAATSGFGAGDVKGPNSQTAGNIPVWSGTAKTLTDGKTVQTSVRASGSATDLAMPTEKAVRDAIDAEATARAAAVASEASARTTAISTAVADKVTAPTTTTTQGNLPQWDSTQKKLTNGKTVVQSVGETGSHANVPTEKAVRDAIAAATANIGTGDVKGPGSTTEDKVPQWDATAKRLKDGLTVTTSVSGSPSDAKLPTEKAVQLAIAAETSARTAAIGAEATARDAAIAAAIAAAQDVTGPATTTENKVPQWDSTAKKLKDGLTVQTTVRNNANAANTAIPTEKAVRDAVDEKVAAPASHTENCIPQWGAANELKAGKSVATVIGSTGSDDNIPTEKAVRDALPVLATTAAAGLMSAADKAKLDGMVNTSAVEEVGAALADNDVVTVLKGGTTWKKSLLTRLWTYIMGKLPTFRIDDLMEGEDNTDLDTNSSRHGLCPKLTNDVDQFLRGDGEWATPSGSSDFTGDSGTGGEHGLVPAPASGDAAANKFLNANGSWAVPPSAAGVDIPGATAIDAAADADALYSYDASENAYRKMTLAQVAALVMGKKRYDNIFIPAGAMCPSATNGATAGAVSFTNVKRDTMAFSSSVEQGAEFSVVMPEDWDLGAVRAKFLWTAYDSTKAEAGEVVGWKLGAVSTPDEGAITIAPATFVAVTDNLSQVNELHRTGATGALAMDGTKGAGNLAHFVVKRNVSAETANPMDTDALLLGVWIQFGRTASTEEWS